MSLKGKLYTWSTLQTKVFKKMKFEVSRDEIEAIVNCVPGMIEFVLMRLQARISEIKAKRASRGMSASAGSMGHTASTTASGGGIPMPGAAMAAATSGGAGLDRGAPPVTVDGAAGGVRAETALLVQKEQRIQELEETNEYLELKIKKLEQLVRLKDNRISILQAKLSSHREGLA